MAYQSTQQYYTLSINEILRKLNEIAQRLDNISRGMNQSYIAQHPNITPVTPTPESGKLIQYFPNDKKWKWIPIALPSIAVQPRTEYEFWDKSANGWLYYVFIQSDNPDILYGLDIHADGIIEMRLSPRMLYNWGQIGSSGYAMHVTKYDDTNNIYVVEMAPGFQNGLGIPFRGRNRTFAYNPTSETVTLTLYAWIIETS